MNNIEIISHFQKLLSEKEPFAWVTVVRREAPCSGKIGDKAIVNAQGKIFGWVGGGCTQGIILKESLDAIRTGKSRLVKISKNMNKENKENIKEYTMTCHSEGSLELLVEAIMPPPHLVVIGKSENAKALVHIAKIIGYRVTAVGNNVNIDTYNQVDELITRINLKEVKTGKNTMFVVATQGENDQEALVACLNKNPVYLSFISSAKKMNRIKSNLKELGFNDDKIKAIVSPAGIDIHAKSPYEVAISIMAEIIAFKNSHQVVYDDSQGSEKDTLNQTIASNNYYINPVCGIPIDKNNPKHIIQYNKEKIYFCCDGCKEKFESDPVKYMKK